MRVGQSRFWILYAIGATFAKLVFAARAEMGRKPEAFSVREQMRFSHVEPFLDATELENLWFFDGVPQMPEQLARNFEAVPQRLLFCGHFHTWQIATPQGIVPWDEYVRDYFSAAGALFRARRAGVRRLFCCVRHTNICADTLHGRFMTYAIGIDLGGTNIKFVAATPTGAILSRASAPTYDDNADWAQTIRALIERIADEQGSAPQVVGLCAPGLAAPDGRSILWMQGRLEAVQNLDWTQYLGFEKTVIVLNDAQAALLGEIWLGAAKGARNAILLTLGTGVGGGIVCDGHLLRGHIGRAGHLGHISLDPNGQKDIVNTPGSLEDAIGDCTVNQRSNGRFTSTAALVQAYRNGDQNAAEIWLRSVQILAAAIVSLSNAVDPEIVILGGGVAAGAGDSLLAPLQKYLDAWEWRPTGSQIKIVPAILGEYAGACGAVYEALQANK